MSLFYIIVSFFVVVILWLILSFNCLVRRRFRVKESWSDMDVQLKRRYDLIPNIVATVKGYAAHERELFEKVTDARTRALNSQTREEKLRNEEMLSGTLKTLFAVAENYPDLKANANFLDLQRELADAENKIQASRRFYNGVVRDLNTKIQTFPSNFTAKLFGFREEEFFGTESEKEREAVKVDF